MRRVMDQGFTRRMLAVVLGVAVMAGALIVASCDSSDSNGVSGNTTIIGNVSSYVAGSTFFTPSRRARGLARILDRALNLLVPPAVAGLGGVTITVAGTDLKAEAEDDGSFVISGVPAGAQQLIFTYGESTALLSIDVPANATITLSGIAISGGTVNIGGVSIQVNDNTSTANENDNAVVDDNANDNAPMDDNSNDNVVVDDNSNDNLPVDDNANDNLPIDDNSNDNVVVIDNDNVV